jgi:flagellar biosynthesis/type III secretory pathway chaperone
MSFSEIYDRFCTSAESLLQVMQMEEQYIKDVRLNELDSFLQKKTELFEANQDLASQILEQSCWKQLSKPEQQNVNRLLKAVVLGMKNNISLLDISKRGSKKLMELCFDKIKIKPFFYTSSGKMFETSYAPSLGVQQMA